MNADEIRRALFPHEETIKRLQEEIKGLKAQIETLTKELANAQKPQQPVSEETPSTKRARKTKAESSQGTEFGDADSVSEG